MSLVEFYELSSTVCNSELLLGCSAEDNQDLAMRVQQLEKSLETQTEAEKVQVERLISLATVIGGKFSADRSLLLGLKKPTFAFVACR